jgi:hypothetical protein
MAVRDRIEFWRDVAERTIRGFAQGMLAGLSVGAATFDKGGLPWLDAFYIGLGSAVIALLLSLAGHRIGDPINGSLRKASAPPSDPSSSLPIPDKP